MTFSIIIPHKNSIKLLQRCLDSIPDRDDLEVIVVDDNSDLTMEDRHLFPGLDKPNTSVVFTTESRGAGYARNVGLDLAKGTWVLFADSDDFFGDDLFVVLEKAADSNKDIIFFKHHCVLSHDTSISAKRSEELNVFVEMFLNQVPEAEQLLRIKWGVPWAKIIRKQLIDDNHIRFSESRYANDVYFSVQAGVLAKGVGALSNDAYVVTVRKGSLSSDFCGTSREVRVRLAEALKTDRFVREKMPSCCLKTEADVILWYVLQDKGYAYLWKCAMDCCFSDPKVFSVISWFLVKRGFKALAPKKKFQ